MKRGDLYRLRRPGDDPKKSRVYLVVSRSSLIATKFDSLICAPVYTKRRGLATEVEVGVAEGLKHDSSVLCDGLVSIKKSALTDYLGALSPAKLEELRTALKVALDL